MDRSDNPGRVSQGNRRAFLRRAATSTTLGFVGLRAFSDQAVGRPVDVDEEALAEAQNAYDSPEKVRQAVKEHGAEVLQFLASEGILAAPAVENLPIDWILTPEEFTNHEEGTIVTAKSPEGLPSAHITISKMIEKTDVLITIFPQADKAYARIRGNGETRIYDPDSGHDGSFSTSTCYTGYTCARCNCGQYACGCCDWEVVCCSDDCYFDVEIDSTCDPCYDQCWGYCEDPCYGDYENDC